MHHNHSAVPLSPRVSLQTVTAGQHDGRPLLALAMRPYAYLLPSRRARSLAFALTACGAPLCAAARLAQAAMCWSGAIGQSSSRRLRWRLRVALYIDPDATVQVRRFVQLHARAHGALASRALLLCVSRCVRCLSSVLACVHVSSTCLATEGPEPRLASASRLCAGGRP